MHDNLLINRTDRFGEIRRNLWELEILNRATAILRRETTGFKVEMITFNRVEKDFNPKMKSFNRETEDFSREIRNFKREMEDSSRGMQSFNRKTGDFLQKMIDFNQKDVSRRGRKTLNPGKEKMPRASYRKCR
jgi:hypothetical protein